MSIKRYCDCCEAELDRNVVSDRIKESTVIDGKNIGVEIIVSMNGVANKGDLCHACLKAVLDRVV